jgi:hypothetical protein
MYSKNFPRCVPLNVGIAFLMTWPKNALDRVSLGS